MHKSQETIILRQKKSFDRENKDVRTQSDDPKNPD